MFKLLVALALVGIAVAKPQFAIGGYSPLAYTAPAVAYSAPAVAYPSYSAYSAYPYSTYAAYPGYSAYSAYSAPISYGYGYPSNYAYLYKRK